MTSKNRERLYEALTTAAQMIEGHGEVGHEPEDMGEETEEGLQEYYKACGRAAKMIFTLAKKYKP